MLTAVMKFYFGKDLADLGRTIPRFDVLVAKCDHPGKEVKSSINNAVLIGGKPEPLETQVQVQSLSVGVYEKLRGMVTSCVQSKRVLLLWYITEAGTSYDRAAHVEICLSLREVSWHSGANLNPTSRYLPGKRS